MKTFFVLKCSFSPPRKHLHKHKLKWMANRNHYPALSSRPFASPIHLWITETNWSVRLHPRLVVASDFSRFYTDQPKSSGRYKKNEYPPLSGHYDPPYPDVTSCGCESRGGCVQHVAVRVSVSRDGGKTYHIKGTDDTVVFVTCAYTSIIASVEKSARREVSIPSTKHDVSQTHYQRVTGKGGFKKRFSSERTSWEVKK